MLGTGDYSEPLLDSAKIMSSHLLSLFDFGQASVEDGALVCEVDAIELLRNLLSDQLLRPAVWAINDDQPGNRMLLSCSTSCNVRECFSAPMAVNIHLELARLGYAVLC